MRNIFHRRAIAFAGFVHGNSLELSFLARQSVHTVRHQTLTKLPNIDQIPILALGTLATLRRRIMLETTKWDELYLGPILEVDGHQMPERITATRQAI